MKLLLAGGGTGGHLVPGLAVADALRRRDPDAHVWVFGTPRPIDRRLVPAAGIPLFEQAVQPFSTRPWRWPGFYLAWRASCRAAGDFLRAEHPDVVLGLGGYAAGPAVAAAARIGLPAAILNPDAIPGRANRYLARRVDRVFCQWDVTVQRLPRPHAARVVGCPVRAGLALLDRRACRRELGLDEHRPLLLVTGASLGARTINEAVPPALARIADRLDQPWQVLHQTGASPFSRDPKGSAPPDARDPNGSAPTDARDPRGGVPPVFSYRRVEFLDNLPAAIAAADLVVCRAGASTLAELTAVGRPAVLMPYPFHRDQHQRHNGQVLVDAGAAVMIADRRHPDANADALAPTLAELMTDPARREAMGQAARSLGRPDSADAVVDELLRLP